MWELLFLLLPVAALSGFAFGRKARHPYEGKLELPSDYYAGLEYLLNEQTDKAVDAFTKMLNESPDSVETTLALGNLFRRKGEVDRAIRIHQGLIAKPTLTHRQRARALMQLGRDYMQAGVFDRAESLFCELTNLGADEFSSSQVHLMTIYEREKDWSLAIKAAYALQHHTGKSMVKRIAQYQCELAEVALSKGNTQEAYDLVHKALNTDRKCVRASILLGTLEKSFQNFKGAIRAFKRIEHQDVNFLCEVVQYVADCYESIGDTSALLKYLEYLLRCYPSVSIVLVYAKVIQNLQGDRAAANYVTEYMRGHPSIRGLSHLVNFHLARVQGSTRDDLLMLKGLIDKLLSKKPVYICKGCGLAIKSLHWQCPSCREWNTVKPIHGLEGE